MAESDTHKCLVSALVERIALDFFFGDKGSILVDSSSSSRECKPPSIEGFVPDVYAKGFGGGFTVVGEAKTAGDIECRHSSDQFRAFLQHCSQRNNAVFIVAVPWHMTRFAKALISRC